MILPEFDPRRQAVIAEAETWLGTPFVHATMIKGRGVDCIMLLAACFSDAGVVPFVDPRPYPQQWFLHHDTERYLNGLMQYGQEMEHPEPGDVGVWKFGRCFSHGGILVTPFIDDPNPYHLQGNVIHALQRNGKVARDPLTMGDLLWRPGGRRAVKWFSPYP